MAPWLFVPGTSENQVRHHIVCIVGQLGVLLTFFSDKYLLSLYSWWRQRYLEMVQYRAKYELGRTEKEKNGMCLSTLVYVFIQIFKKKPLNGA